MQSKKDTGNKKVGSYRAEFTIEEQSKLFSHHRKKKIRKVIF
tara:strand:+ start:84 stop:209 length:126 start_codon:yes stop_codon:yes gene_type:complete